MSLIFGKDNEKFSSSAGNQNTEEHSESFRKSKNYFPSLKSSKIYRKPMSEYLQRELEDFFDAATSSENPELLDQAFALHSSSPTNQNSASFYFDRSNLASPFRSDDYAFTERKQNPTSALANITSEIYGRYDPVRSKMRLVRPGEVEMVYPNGDPCYHLLDAPSVSQGSTTATKSSVGVTSWTTYLRFVCSFHEIGRTAVAAVNLNDHVEGDVDEESLSQDPIRWDVRVNAAQCMVNVFVFTDAVC